MNILLVSAMFPPIRTGTSAYSKNLAHALIERGHSVTVVALASNMRELEHYSFDVHRLPCVRVPFIPFFKHFRISAAYPKNYSRMRKLAKDNSADVIILVNHYLDIAFLASYAARSVGVPLVCSVGTQLQSSDLWRHKLLNFFDRLICGKLVFPACDRIIAWDREILRYLSDVHGNKIREKCLIVNYGVDGDSVALGSSSHDYGLHNQIVCVGSVIKQRSCVPIVCAFGLIADEFPQLKLKIIGHIYFDEAVRVANKLSIADRIIFSGELPHEDVIQELSRSDAYYVSLTGRYLGLGTATIEAMLMGLPVIANVPADLLGLARMEDGTHLTICDDLRPEAVASKLRAMLLDSEFRSHIGQHGRRFIQEQMSWEKVAKDMEMAIQPLVARHE